MANSLWLPTSCRHEVIIGITGALESHVSGGILAQLLALDLSPKKEQESGIFQPHSYSCSRGKLAW